MILFFIDDIIVVYFSKDALKFADFNKKLLIKYKIRVLEDTENFLNIRIFKKRFFRRFYLVLNVFIKKITNKFYISIIDKLSKISLLSYINFSVYIGQAFIN